MDTFTPEARERIAKQVYEAAILVEFANTGKKSFMADPEMYKQCGTELAFIANAIAAIRAKGFGKDIVPNTFTN